MPITSGCEFPVGHHILTITTNLVVSTYKKINKSESFSSQLVKTRALLPNYSQIFSSGLNKYNLAPSHIHTVMKNITLSSSPWSHSFYPCLYSCYLLSCTKQKPPDLPSPALFTVRQFSLHRSHLPSLI